jgi:hypothetical protein
MFRDQLECYQAIANDLITMTNQDWAKIQVEATRTSDSSMNMVITSFLKDGREASLDKAGFLPFYFDSLANLVSTPEKGLYKKCTFILFKDGKFDSNFDY